MDSYALFKLSIQTALIGKITDNLFAVTCGISKKRLTIDVYFDGAVKNEDAELARRIGREVLADFSDGFIAETRCHSIQENPPRMLDFWALLRANPIEQRWPVARLLPKAAGF